MSGGNPRNAPCRDVLERVYSYLDSELDQTGYEKIRPPGNDANFKQPVQRLRFPAARAWRRASPPASPRTAAITAVFACQIESHRYWQQLAGRTSPIRRGLHGRGAPR